MNSTAPFTIRPFTSADYNALCHVINTTFPDYPETPKEVRHSDENRNRALHQKRWVAHVAGEIVGFAHAVQAHVDEPQKFAIDSMVLPKWRGQGIGKALYTHLETALTSRQPHSFRTMAHENESRGQQFLQARGFVEVMREQESKLDLANWEPENWIMDKERLLQSGLKIRTYSELVASYADIDALYWQLDDLHWALRQDIPSSEPPVRQPHADFVKRFVEPHFLPDGNFFALDGHQLVGKSLLWASEASNDLFTGTTGVLRSYRGRGIATALKVAALTHAKNSGAAGVRTFNEVNNQAMLGINRRLGFEPLPTWIEYRKTFDPRND